jgi:hypothetical protein
MKDAPEWFQAMVRRIVRENVPDRYVVDKDWGKTDRRWDGLKIRREGFQIRTNRRWKEVNHGTWRRYEIIQIDPLTNLRLRIENVHDAGDGNVAFEVSLASKLRALGRQSKWTKGVQLYSISVEADADVQMRIWCQVGMELDFMKLPPDVLLVPRVAQADLDITSFQLDRVSKFDGPLVEQFGKQLHKVLRAKIEDKRTRLPEKINRQIAKNEDKMRFSISDFAANRWQALAGGRSPTDSAGESAPASDATPLSAGDRVPNTPLLEDRVESLEDDLIDLVPADGQVEVVPQFGPVLSGPTNQ